jgi:hypothetical protein
MIYKPHPTLPEGEGLKTSLPLTPPKKGEKNQYAYLFALMLVNS